MAIRWGPRSRWDPRLLRAIQGAPPRITKKGATMAGERIQEEESAGHPTLPHRVSKVRLEVYAGCEEHQRAQAPTPGGANPQRGGAAAKLCPPHPGRAPCAPFTRCSTAGAPRRSTAGVGTHPTTHGARIIMQHDRVSCTPPHNRVGITSPRCGCAPSHPKSRLSGLMPLTPSDGDSGKLKQRKRGDLAMEEKEEKDREGGRKDRRKKTGRKNQRPEERDGKTKTAKQKKRTDTRLTHCHTRREDAEALRCVAAIKCGVLPVCVRVRGIREVRNPFIPVSATQSVYRTVVVRVADRVLIRMVCILPRSPFSQSEEKSPNSVMYHMWCKISLEPRVKNAAKCCEISWVIPSLTVSLQHQDLAASRGIISEPGD
ncbi:hypothetical protein C8J57DRAFT_1599305 [Mycena rebaudengoi]|nr:hypothetical protein C8J57DRAFT_1599305 [Mycena rebaudengoi]